MGGLPECVGRRLGSRRILRQASGGCDRTADERAASSRFFLCRRAARPSAVRKRRADRPIIGMARSAAPGFSTPHPQARSAPARSERRERQCGFGRYNRRHQRGSRSRSGVCADGDLRSTPTSEADGLTHRQGHRPGDGSARRSARCLKGFGSPSRTRTCDKAINSRGDVVDFIGRRYRGEGDSLWRNPIRGDLLPRLPTDGGIGSRHG